MVELQSGNGSCGGRTPATAGPRKSLCREPVRQEGKGHRVLGFFLGGAPGTLYDRMLRDHWVY